LNLTERVVLFFKVVVMGSGKGAMEEGSVFGINEEIEVEIVWDNGCGGG
jgi:hypothetical protein